MWCGEGCQANSQLALTCLGECPCKRSAQISDLHQLTVRVAPLMLTLIATVELGNEMLGKLARDGVKLARFRQFCRRVSARRIQEAQIARSVEYRWREQ